MLSYVATKEAIQNPLTGQCLKKICFFYGSYVIISLFLSSLLMKEERMRFCSEKNGNRAVCRGLTLIELLVVVSIVAILATIAVVNYSLAQTRAKVSVVKNDLRVLAGSLETYN